VNPSQELHALLHDKLDTFEKVELVLHLRAATNPLTVDDLALELQVGRVALRRVAGEVAATGLVELADDRVQLVPGAWDPLLAELATLYADDPAQLLHILTRITMLEIRNRTVRGRGAKR
jgi:hypothetical protein